MFTPGALFVLWTEKSGREVKRKHKNVSTKWRAKAFRSHKMDEAERILFMCKYCSSDSCRGNGILSERCPCKDITHVTMPSDEHRFPELTLV